VDPFTAYNAATSTVSAARFDVRYCKREEEYASLRAGLSRVTGDASAYLVWFREYSLELIRNFFEGEVDKSEILAGLHR
jgi:hypothetical protein